MQLHAKMTIADLLVMETTQIVILPVFTLFLLRKNVPLYLEKNNIKKIKVCQFADKFWKYLPVLSGRCSLRAYCPNERSESMPGGLPGHTLLGKCLKNWTKRRHVRGLWQPNMTLMLYQSSMVGNKVPIIFHFQPIFDIFYNFINWGLI